MWLKTSPVKAMLADIRIANIIYIAVLAVFAVLLTLILVRDKKQRRVQMIVAAVFAVYLGTSAFGFVNLDYSGEGRYYAQFITKSITAAFIFIPACPHIVMALNTLASKSKG